MGKELVWQDPRLIEGREIAGFKEKNRSTVGVVETA